MKRVFVQFKAFGMTFNERKYIDERDLTKPIYLVHTPPMRMFFGPEALDPVKRTMLKARFEWQGKYADLDHKFAVFELVELE